MDPSSSDTSERLRWLFERIPGVCVIETDAHGIFSRFDSTAERFFGCASEEALGKLHYRDFHDPVEMEKCVNDPDFRRSMEETGWTEADWIVRPRKGAIFRSRVTLIRTTPDPGSGWIALYQRIPTT